MVSMWPWQWHYGYSKGVLCLMVPAQSCDVALCGMDRGKVRECVLYDSIRNLTLATYVSVILEVAEKITCVCVGGRGSEIEIC